VGGFEEMRLEVLGLTLVIACFLNIHNQIYGLIFGKKKNMISCAA